MKASIDTKCSFEESERSRLRSVTDEVLVANSISETQASTINSSAVRKRKVKCSVCYNDFCDDAISCLSCADNYCVECLKGLFMGSTRDHSLFPPRCCRKVIPQSLIQDHLSTIEAQPFENARIEFNTTEKSYSSNTSCGIFIGPSHTKANEAECPKCLTSTCTLCRNSSHEGDCPVDQDLQATRALAAAQGRQRCFACNALVELQIGCNHTT